MKDNQYHVAEIFRSIQGEGHFMGYPATFIRLYGCNVRCSWCDTVRAWELQGEGQSAEQVVSTLESTRHIVITGGEPTIYNLDPLISAIMEKCDPDTIQLETSGACNLKGALTPDWVTWSPKPALQYQAALEIYQLVNEVKFVVSDLLRMETVVKIAALVTQQSRVSDLVMFSFMPLTTDGAVDPKVAKRAIRFAYQLESMGYYAMYSDRLQLRIGVL